MAWSGCSFGPDYLIPKPFDPRVLLWEATAVAEAAMESGVARNPIALDEYRDQLERRLGKAHEIAHMMIQKAQPRPKQSRISGRRAREDSARRPHHLLEEKIALPILLGNTRRRFKAKKAELGLGPNRRKIVDPKQSPLRERLHPGVVPHASAARRHSQRSARADEGSATCLAR